LINIKEKQLLEWIPDVFQQGDDVIIGPGDDCAVLDFGLDRLYLLAVDQLTADTHYLQATTSPAQIAKKLLHRNISDIAAMGGVPAHALLAITLAPGKEKAWFEEFFRAMAEEAEKWSISICGGDISSTATGKDSASLTITGWVENQALSLRSGANDGDILYATGCFGESFKTEHHLNFIPRLEEARFIAGSFSNTMIDVSDGLLLDSARLAESSKIGLMLEVDKIPLRNNAELKAALTDGEDYELLFAVPAEKAENIEQKWPFKETPLTAIGKFTKEIFSGTVENSTGEIIYSPVQAPSRNNASCKAYSNPGFDHLT